MSQPAKVTTCRTSQHEGTRIYRHAGAQSAAVNSVTSARSTSSIPPSAAFSAASSSQRDVGQQPPQHDQQTNRKINLLRRQTSDPLHVILPHNIAQPSRFALL